VFDVEADVEAHAGAAWPADRLAADDRAVAIGLLQLLSSVMRRWCSADISVKVKPTRVTSVTLVQRALSAAEAHARLPPRGKAGRDWFLQSLC